MQSLDMAVIGFERYSDGEWFAKDNLILAGSNFTGKPLDFTRYFPIAGRIVVQVAKEKVDDVLLGYSRNIDLSGEGNYPAEYVLSRLDGVDRDLSDYLEAPTCAGKLVRMEPDKDIFMPIFKHHLPHDLANKDHYFFNVPYRVSFATRLYSQSQDEIGSLQVTFTLEDDRRRYYVSCKSAFRDISESIFGKSFDGIVYPNFIASVQETRYEFKDTFGLINEITPYLHNSIHASTCMVSKEEDSSTVLDVDYGVPLHILFHIQDTHIFGPFEQGQVDGLKKLLNWVPQLMERNHEFLYLPK